MAVVSPEFAKRIAGNIADLQHAMSEAKDQITVTSEHMQRMAETYTVEGRKAEAKEWAHRMRRLEAEATRWIYESESDSSADVARRTLAQTVGLRRLLDQIAGCVSAHRGEQS